MTAKSVTIKLDKERTLVYNNRAEFRMGSLDRPFIVSDLKNRRRCWAALVAWVWACLCEKDALELQSPEAVAPLLESEASINEAFEKFLETYNGGQPNELKNAAG